MHHSISGDQYGQCVIDGAFEHAVLTAQDRFRPLAGLVAGDPLFWNVVAEDLPATSEEFANLELATLSTRERDFMSAVLEYDGEYFRLETAEMTSGDDQKTAFVTWCSDAFKDLKDMPNQRLARFVEGPPQASYDDACRYAIGWIKAQRDLQTKKTDQVRDLSQVIYTVWIFKEGGSTGFEFEEFADARTFATAAEKSRESTRVVITNNESPQYLTVWERKE